jgi:hypothetical protein
MSEDVLDHFPPSFPTRFRGYDRDAVDHEVSELRAALDYAQAERDRAVARALALETGAAGDQTPAQTSAAVRWLIDSAESDAGRIRAAADEAARQVTEQAEELLRRRVEMVEEAQHEADVCRARAAEEARRIVHEALEKASTLLRGLQESEVSLQEMFGSGALRHRMPPPRRQAEKGRGQHAAPSQPASQPAQSVSPSASQPAPQPVPQPRSQAVSQPVSQPVQQPVHAAAETQQGLASQQAGDPDPQHVPAALPLRGEPPRS